MKPVEALRRFVKSSLSGALYYSGILALIRKLRMQDHAVILMYHRVINRENIPYDYVPPDMVVDADKFEQQVNYLRKHYSVVPLSEIIGHLRNNRSLPPNLCAITFDDGWYDIYENAVPVLNKYNLPYTVFLTINFVENKNWFWEQRLKYMIFFLASVRQKHLLKWESGSAVSEISEYLPHLGRLNAQQKKQFAEELIRKLYQSGKDQINNTICGLEEHLTRMGYDLKSPFIGWGEISEMASQNAEFGAHTVTHPDLTRCDQEQLSYEISEARRIIQEKLNRDITLFAYPYGKNSQNTREIVKQEKFLGACGTKLGLVPLDSNLYLLNRINIYNDVTPNRAMFAGRILNLLNFSTD